MRPRIVVATALGLALVGVPEPAAAGHPCDQGPDPGPCNHPPGGTVGAVVPLACGVIGKTHVVSCFGA